MNSQTKMRIAIIHPEGNFNNNPHLSATIEALAKNNYHVEIHAIRKHFNQAPPHPDVSVHLYSKYVMRIVRLLYRYSFGRLPAAWLCALQFRQCDADFFIGVDDNGMIIAACLGARLERPIALINYELLFASEVGKRRKSAEIHACKGIEFAVVQDAQRGALLARENDIDTEKLIFMPVAAWSSAAAERGWLRQSLEIAPDKKIALVMGSLDKWTGLDTVLKGLPDWPDNWVLVVHSRYGLTADQAQEFLQNNSGNLYISTDAFASNDDLGMLLGDADIGLGFYCPDFKNEYTGLNLKHIGLASGKIATFLRFGVPVLVNDLGEMAEHVTNDSLGAVVSRIEEVPGALKEISSKDPTASDRCQHFFDLELAVSGKIQALLDRIDAL